MIRPDDLEEVLSDNSRVYDAIASTCLKRVKESSDPFVITPYAACALFGTPLSSPLHRELCAAVTEAEQRAPADWNDNHAVLDAFLNDTSPAFELLPDSNRRHLINMLIASMSWAGNSYPYFAVTDGLAAALWATDVGADRLSEPVHLPFDAMMIRLLIPITGISTILVASGPSESGRRKMLCYINRVPEEDGHPPWRLVLQSHSDGTWNDFLGETAVGHVSVARFVANLALYIHEHGGPPAEKVVGPNIHVEREHRTKPVFRCGRPIKLGRDLRAALHASAAGGTSWKLASRFLVRGHWRNQAYGPGRTERRRTWIEPHWKGPKDVTDALIREYEVHGGER